MLGELVMCCSVSQFPSRFGDVNPGSCNMVEGKWETSPKYPNHQVEGSSPSLFKVELLPVARTCRCASPSVQEAGSSTHFLSEWPRTSPNFVFTTKMVFSKSDSSPVFQEACSQQIPPI